MSVTAASHQQGQELSAVGTRPKVSPHTYDLVPAFVVAIINDTTILRAQLSVGATMIASENAELKRPENVTVTQQVRVMVYSPNLCGEDFPHYLWDAEILIDGKSHHVGSIERRCEVHHLLLGVPGTSRRVQLRVHRIKQRIQKTKESEALCKQVVEMMQDQNFNPRTGSLPLPVVAREAQTRFPMAYRKVIGGEYFGSFRGFIIAHETMIAIFKYRDKEVAKKHNSTIEEERIAIRKEVRDSSPPMLAPGDAKETVVINLIREALRERDSHVHRLIRVLSVHDDFRIGMSAAFSSLMHWLQRHRDIFRWSTDPQQLCTIGLVPGAVFDPEQPLPKGNAFKSNRPTLAYGLQLAEKARAAQGTSGAAEGLSVVAASQNTTEDESEPARRSGLEEELDVEAALDEEEDISGENEGVLAIGDEGEEEFDEEDLEEVSNPGLLDEGLQQHQQENQDQPSDGSNTVG